MVTRPSVLCPIDFSDASRTALQYAAAVAEHFCARLTLLTVNEQPMAEFLEMKTGTRWLADESRRGLEDFLDQTFDGRRPAGVDLAFEATGGKPAPAILQFAREHACDLIVMSTHGLSGVRKLFFGSTTERVLRETTLPVLVTPPADAGLRSLNELAPRIGRVLVPVDLSAATSRQVLVARALAEALDVPLLLLHAIAPIDTRNLSNMAGNARTARTRGALDELVATIPCRLAPEAVLVQGDAADAIARTARERSAGLIVMGLHDATAPGPRMGSITYRVLCQTRALVLALPPATEPGRQHQEVPFTEGWKPVPLFAAF
jgi:nucleotide-binding universal stress UspA family protein